MQESKNANLAASVLNHDCPGTNPLHKLFRDQATVGDLATIHLRPNHKGDALQGRILLPWVGFEPATSNLWLSSSTPKTSSKNLSTVGKTERIHTDILESNL